MLEFLVQLDLLREIPCLPIHTHTHKTIAAGFSKNLLILALAPAHDRSQDLKLRLFRQFENSVHDLLHGLAFYFFAAGRAVWLADTREQQTKIIINLRYRAHGRARVATGCLLFDGYRR